MYTIKLPPLARALKQLKRNAELSHNSSCHDPALFVQLNTAHWSWCKLTVICLYQVKATIVKLPSAFVSPWNKLSFWYGLPSEKGAFSSRQRPEPAGPFWITILWGISWYLLLKRWSALSRRTDCWLLLCFPWLIGWKSVSCWYNSGEKAVIRGRERAKGGVESADLKKHGWLAFWGLMRTLSL